MRIQRFINSMLARTTLLLVAGVLGLFILLGCRQDDDPVAPPPLNPADTIPHLPGWSLVWHDEFDGPAIDTTKWSFETGGHGWGNNELQYYTGYRSNSFLDSGKLVIKAVQENFMGLQYTSARINSRPACSWTYGRFEVRALLPYGKGVWPAIWMLPTDWVYGGWPMSGEIDIMELLGDNTTKVYGTIHYADNSGQHRHTGGSYTLPRGTFAGEYHTFSLEWDTTGMRWYVDSTLYHTETKGHPFNQRFHFLFNIAVGGNWPGNPDASTVFPQYMKIDYVRVFRKTENAPVHE